MYNWFLYLETLTERKTKKNITYSTVIHVVTPDILFSYLFPRVLKQRYQITAVPKLVIVKENGDVITDKGRKQIRDRGLACFRSWLDAAEIFQNFKG